MAKNDDWKRRIINMTFTEKNAFQDQNKLELEKQINWMF